MWSAVWPNDRCTASQWRFGNSACCIKASFFILNVLYLPWCHLIDFFSCSSDKLMVPTFDSLRSYVNYVSARHTSILNSDMDTYIPLKIYYIEATMQVHNVNIVISIIHRKQLALIFRVKQSDISFLLHVVSLNQTKMQNWAIHFHWSSFPYFIWNGYLRCFALETIDRLQHSIGHHNIWMQVVLTGTLHPKL
jgi:hypothetical protein